MCNFTNFLQTINLSIIHNLWRRLESNHIKGGISRLTPDGLASTLQSLPPILHMIRPNPMPSCSKAPRGLSVLSRVNGIFTANAISPGPSLRQYPDRSAIRAGRNLPDKEFRSICYSTFVGSSHFCQTLYVAIEFGLYLSYC